MKTETRTPFRVRCKCGHEWIAAYTPMILMDFAQIAQSLRCPMCSGDGKTIWPILEITKG